MKNNCQIDVSAFLSEKIYMKVFTIKFLAALFFILTMTFSNDAQITDASYRMFDARGNSVTVSQIVEAIGSADAVLLGESHDDAVAHHLQLAILKQVVENHGKKRKIALALEMFERDAQIVLDEYLQNLITEKKFLDDSRPWNNYKTDYRPLFEFARENNLPVIAANAPRRYVNMVSRSGRAALDKLAPDARKYLAPLPFGQPSKNYAAKFTALMNGMEMKNSNLIDSQTLWDATMAFSINEFLTKEKTALVVHLNGSFHSESRMGAPEHLTRFNPKAKFIVVTMKPEKDFTNFIKSRDENLGDFVILTDAAVPRSFK